MACVVVILAAALLDRALLGSLSPEDTLGRAYSFVDLPFRLERALEVEWRFATRDPDMLAASADDLLVPPMPPFLCHAGLAGAAGPRPFVRELDQTIRQAQREEDTGSRSGLERAVEALEGQLESLSGDQLQVAYYDLARALAAGGDWAGAARWLHAMPLTESGGGPLPVLNTTTPSRAVRAPLVALAFYSRYLAGVVALRRDEPEPAIYHFRRAINAVRYVLNTSPAVGLSGGHYERTDMRPGVLSCADSRRRDLTSLDAYAGLVAAYTAAPDFRDPHPRDLTAEVARGSFQMDPGDPLAPLLRHAQEATASRRPLDPVPENVVWAASNLQRVYHYNRFRPDPGLAASRAVVTWRVVDEPTWTEALGVDAEEQCRMLETVADGFHRDGAALDRPDREWTSADSTWAAVAVGTFARVDARCPGDMEERTEGGVRELWLGLSSKYVHAGLIAQYDTLRQALQVGAGAARELGGGAGSDQYASILERARGHARTFARGRIPPGMSMAVDPAVAGEFVTEWRRAVFREVADQLVKRAGDPVALSRVRSRDAASYVKTVEAAVAHAGLRPSDIYGADEMAPLLRPQGESRAFGSRLRHHARNHPHMARATVGLLALLGLGVAVTVFVNWWRFFLLARTDFYAEEAAERGRPVGPVP